MVQSQGSESEGRGSEMEKVGKQVSVLLNGPQLQEKTQLSCLIDQGLPVSVGFPAPQGSVSRHL